MVRDKITNLYVVICFFLGSGKFGCKHNPFLHYVCIHLIQHEIHYYSWYLFLFRI